MMRYDCPHDPCDVRGIHGAHRLFTHWFGAHYRKETEETRRNNRQRLEKLSGDYAVNVPSLILERLHEYEDGIPDEDTNDIAVAETERGPHGIVSDPDGPYRIDRFLNPKQPLCREERHYAHLLASRLRGPDADRGLLERLGIKGTVLEVIFEVTLMRDFWAAQNDEGRDQFTKKLKKYVKKQLDGPESRDLSVASHGRFPAAHDSHPLVRWMMRAKPDIGILWEPATEPRRPTLTFLECKYLSKPSRYREDGFSREQVEVQQSILKFLCDELPLKNGSTEEAGLPVHAGGVVLVEFVADSGAGGPENNDAESGDSGDVVTRVTVSLAELLR